MIRQWSLENMLLLNATKTQTVVTGPLKIGSDTIPYLNSVRNLGLHVDHRLNWEKHVSHIVSRVYGVLCLLNRFRDNMTQDLRLYHVRSLVILIFLYSDVVYFPSLNGIAYRRLELAFNACVRYVYGLRRFDHISFYERDILGWDLFTYFELRLATFVHSVSLSARPAYLSSYLRTGSTLRQRFFLAPRPIPSTALRNDSTIYRGIRL
jgi:hypothetical protein